MTGRYCAGGGGVFHNLLPGSLLAGHCVLGGEEPLELRHEAGGPSPGRLLSLLYERPTVSDSEVTVSPLMVDVVQQGGVEEVGGAPDLLLQREVFVEAAVPDHLDGDPRHVEAQHQQGELLALLPGQPVEVLGEGEDLWCGHQVDRLDEAEDAHAPQVSAGVGALEADLLPM